MSSFDGNVDPTTLIPDWKLNPNVHCRVTLDRLIIPIPKNIGFCRETVDKEKRSKRGSFIPSQTIGSASAPESISARNSDLEESKVFSNTESSSLHVFQSNQNNDQQHMSSETESFKSEPILEEHEYTNHYFTIENNLKQESESGDIDIECQEDPLLDYHENDFNLTDNNTTKNQSNLSIELPPQLQITLILPEREQDVAVTTLFSKKRYQCLSCGEKFRSCNALSKNDKEIHAGEKFYKCYICEETFVSKYRRASHILVHSGERDSLHKCDIFGRKFVKNSILTKHKLIHIHKDKGEKLEKHSYKCEICGKIFFYYWILVKHKKNAHNQEDSNSNKCEFCQKCFPTISSLLIHTSEHTGEKIHKCEICGKCYPQNNRLTRHKLAHNAQRPQYKCDMCDKSYIEFCKLTKHKLAEHMGEGYKFKCETCGKGFLYSSFLRVHSKTHLNRSRSSASQHKLHKCGVCGKRTKTLGNLNNHLVIHRRDTTERK